MENPELNEKAEWTEVIGPGRGLFDIRLSELWRYRDLVYLFVKRDFVALYKQTILGPLWFFIQPILTTVVFFVIFNNVAKIPTDNINPVLFYLSGITLWNYFSDCLLKTSSTFTANASIFGKVYFPRLVIPLSIVISNLLKLGLQLGMFCVVYLYLFATGQTQVQITTAVLLFPVLIIVLATTGLGLGIVFSSLTTKYRDLNFLIQFGVQLLMYATPVIYPMSFTSGTFSKIIAMNPLTSIMETFRYSVFGIGQFNIQGLIYAAVFAIVAFAAGIVIFNQVEKDFMDTV